jgi:hypothetical protein
MALDSVEAAVQRRDDGGDPLVLAARQGVRKDADLFGPRARRRSGRSVRTASGTAPKDALRLMRPEPIDGVPVQVRVVGEIHNAQS